MNVPLQNLTLFLDRIDSEVRLDCAGILSEIKSSSFSFHTHTSFEAYFVEKGTMTVLLDGTCLPLKEKDILLISPGVMHRVKEASEDIRKCNLRFLFEAPLTVRANAFWLYETEGFCREEMFQNLEWICRYMQEPQLDPQFLHIKSYLSMIVGDFARVILPQKNYGIKKVFSAAEQNRLNLTIRMDNFFEQRFSQPITASMLAQELNYSTTHLNRLLKQYWGVTFGEKLKAVRLQEAKRLLTETKDPIVSVAQACGYSTLRGFEIFFKKEAGVLPGQYRLEHQSKSS